MVCLQPEPCRRLGRICWVFLRRDFVVRRLQIAEGYARASRLALRKNPLRNYFPLVCMVPVSELVGTSFSDLRVIRPCGRQSTENSEETEGKRVGPLKLF